MLHRGHESRFYQQASSASTALNVRTLYNSLQLSLQVRYGLAFILQSTGARLSSFPSGWMEVEKKCVMKQPLCFM